LSLLVASVSVCGGRNVGVARRLRIRGCLRLSRGDGLFSVSAERRMRLRRRHLLDRGRRRRGA